MSSSTYYMKEVGEESDISLQETGMIIVAAGSDARSYEVIRKSIELGASFESVIVIDFIERRSELTSPQIESFEEIYKMGLPVQRVDCSINDAKNCIQQISNLNLRTNKKLGVDLSSFTKPFFYALFKFLGLNGSSMIYSFYTEPRSYIFSTGSFDSYKSSKGSIKVREIPSFAGNNITDQKPILVILLGFDGGLSREISVEVAPRKTVLINGFPGYEPKYKDLSIINNEKLVSDGSKKLIYSRANNPFELYNILKEELKEYGEDTLISIAPIGSKPMALGACIYAIKHRNIRVIYPMPDKYGVGNNLDTGKSWVYEIPLR